MLCVVVNIPREMTVYLPNKIYTDYEVYTFDGVDSTYVASSNNLKEAERYMMQYVKDEGIKHVSIRCVVSVQIQQVSSDNTQIQ